MKYILIVVWIGVMAFLSHYINTTRNEMVCGQEVQRTTPLFAILVFLPVIIWAGFREGAGYIDTNAYIDTYSSYPDTFKGMIEAIPEIGKDVGFFIFGCLIKIVFGDSYTPFLLIIAIIQGGVLVWFFRKYSSSYLISIFLFVATTEYFSWMFNGIRQFLAVAIVLLATPYILQRKYFKAILLVLIASTIHLSAIIMIPAFFISRGKPWNIKTIIAIVVSIAVIFFVDFFTDFLDVLLDDTQYSEEVSMIASGEDDGVNPIRVLVYAIPAILSLVGKRQLDFDNDSVINMCVNMSILSTGVYLIGMATSGILIGRLPIYMSLYGFILLPYVIRRIFARNTSRVVIFIMIVCYLLYYYYTMHVLYGRF